MSNLTPINQADQSFLTIEHVAEKLHRTTSGLSPSAAVDVPTLFHFRTSAIIACSFGRRFSTG
jgi:hypothetical protein